MANVTYYSNGMIKLSVDDKEIFALTSSMDTEEMVKYLRGKGYLIVEPTDVEICQYISATCPVCGQTTHGKI